MESNEQHFIKRFTFDVEIEQKDKAYSIQNELSDIFNNRLTKIIEQVCDEMEVPDHLLRIREMEIDVGEFLEYELEGDLPHRFERELRRAIAKFKLDASYKSSSYDRNSELIALIPARQEMLVYFLEYGRLPTSASTFPDSIEKIFQDLIREDPQIVRATLLNLGPRMPLTLRRLAERFGPSIIESVLRILSPSYYESVLRTINSYAREMATQQIMPLSRAQALLTEASLRFLVQSAGATFSYPQYIQSVRRSAEKRVEASLEEVFPPESSEEFTQATTELNVRFAGELTVIREIMRGDASPESRSRVLMAWDTLVQQHIVGLSQEIRRGMTRPAPLFRLMEALPSERIYAFLAEVIPNHYRDLVRLIVRVISVHSRYVQGYSADRALRVLLYGHLVRYALEADAQRLNVPAFAAYLKRSLQNAPALPPELMEQWEAEIAPSPRQRKEKDTQRKADPDTDRPSRDPEDEAEDARTDTPSEEETSEDDRPEPETDAAETDAVEEPEGEELSEEERAKAEQEAEEKTEERESREEGDEKEAERESEEEKDAEKEEREDQEEKQAEEEKTEAQKAEEEAAEEEQAQKEAEEKAKEKAEKERQAEEQEAEDKAEITDESESSEEEGEGVDEEKATEESDEAAEESEADPTEAEAQESDETAPEDEALEVEREEEAGEEWEPVEGEGDPETDEELGEEPEPDPVADETLPEVEPEDLLDPAQAQIDLILYILKEGKVPWWARNLQTSDPTEVLRELVERKSELLVPAIEAIVRDTSATGRPELALRFVQQFGDSAISGLMGELVPGFAGFMETIAMAMESYVNRNLPVPRKDQFSGPAEFKWYYLLRYYFDYQQDPVNSTELINYVIQMVAAATGRSQADVAKDLRDISTAANRSGNARFFPLEMSLPRLEGDATAPISNPAAQESVRIEEAYYQSVMDRSEAARKKREEQLRRQDETAPDPTEEADPTDPTESESETSETDAPITPAEEGETPDDSLTISEDLGTTADEPAETADPKDPTADPEDPTTDPEAELRDAAAPSDPKAEKDPAQTPEKESLAEAPAGDPAETPEEKEEGSPVAPEDQPASAEEPIEAAEDAAVTDTPEVSDPSEEEALESRPDDAKPEAEGEETTESPETEGKPGEDSGTEEEKAKDPRDARTDAPVDPEEEKELPVGEALDPAADTPAEEEAEALSEALAAEDDPEGDPEEASGEEKDYYDPLENPMSLEEQEAAAEAAFEARMEEYDARFAELQEASDLNEEEDSEGSQARPIKLGPDTESEKPEAKDTPAEEEAVFGLEEMEAPETGPPVDPETLPLPALELVQYFIETGSLPPNVQLEEEEVLRLVRDTARSQARAVAESLRRVAGRKASTDRLARLDLPTTMALIQTLLPDTRKRQYLSYIAELSRMMRQSRSQETILFVLSHAFTFFGSPAGSSPRVENYLNSLVQYIGRELEQSYLKIIDWLLDMSRNQSSTMASSFREVLVLLRSEAEAPLDRIVPLEESETEEEKEDTTEAGEEEEDPTIYVDNAGLALVFALLPSVFTSVGYLNEKGNFISTDARVRAAHFLAYLSHGKENSPEEELALNKILVGIPAEESVLKEVPMSDEEKKIADEVIQEMLDEWPGMQRTSPQTFRKSWFMRDGKLVPGKKATYVLRVDQESFDMLLGRLPWPYNQFEAEWTKDTIRVEWG